MDMHGHIAFYLPPEQPYMVLLQISNWTNLSYPSGGLTLMHTFWQELGLALCGGITYPSAKPVPCIWQRARMIAGFICLFILMEEYFRELWKHCYVLTGAGGPAVL